MNIKLVFIYIISSIYKIKSQIKDYDLDEDSNLFSDYEHFNIYYTEVKDNSNKKSPWDIDDNIHYNSYKNTKIIEDDYLKIKNSLIDNNDNLNNISNNVVSSNIKEVSNLHYSNIYNIENSNINKDYSDYMHLKNKISNNEYENISNIHKLNLGHPGLNKNNNAYYNNNYNKYYSEYKEVSNNKRNVFWTLMNTKILWFTLSEYFLIFIVLSYLYFYIIGRTFNDKYATLWYEANRQYFESKFEMLGVKPQYENIKNNTELIKDAYNVYRYYVEKHQSIDSITVILEFKRLQSTISLVNSLLFSISDKVYYKVTITPIELIPNIFCICKRKDKNNILKRYDDLKFFTNLYTPSIFDEKLIELAEYDLSADLFKNRDLLYYYKQIENNIDIIYYTDQKTYSKDDYSLYFSFDIRLDIKTKEHYHKLLVLSHFVVLLSYELSQLKYPDSHKLLSKTKRIKYERMKLDEDERLLLEKQDLEEEIKKEKERDKRRYYKGKKLLEEEKKKKINLKKLN